MAARSLSLMPIWMAEERTDAGATSASAAFAGCTALSALSACTASGFFAPDLSLLAFLAMGSLSASYKRKMLPAGRPGASCNDNASAAAPQARLARRCGHQDRRDRKSTRLNSSHLVISYAVFC